MSDVPAQVKALVVEKFTGANSFRLNVSLATSVAALALAICSAPSKETVGLGSNAAQKGASSGGGKGKPGAKGSRKVAVDGAFLRHFRRLLRVAFPSLKSTEGGYLMFLTVLLLLRTWLSLKISASTGQLAKTMVKAELRPFLMAIATLAAWSLPASFVNSGMRYTTALLQVAFRQNLTKHFHKRYLNQDSFFKTVGLGAVDTVEQRISQDVQKFCDQAAEIYSTLFKPIVDIFLFSNKVAEHGGFKGPALIIGYYGMITFIIRVLAPNFGLLASEQQKKDAELRSAHTKLLAYAEEVTLSNGENTMRKLLDEAFRHGNLFAIYTAFMRAKNNLFEGILVKYGSTMVGYAVCAISIFSPEASKMKASELTGLYIHTSQLLVNLARAVGQFILTYKSVASLAGFTDRVYELEEGLASVERKNREAEKRARAAIAAGVEPDSPTAADGGVVTVGETIAFVDVPVVSPDGTVLVKDLSFYVKPGMNLLIVGPNGCGKSSTFRLLGGLWPLHGGKIEKPGYEHLYYVPQRPYMSSGSLRDQVIYPARSRDLKVGESELYKYLEMSCLEGLFDKPQMAWDARLNWSGEALSHGEKQKLAMARLFYHQPRYAILDECSSAVDLDVEEKLYKQCGDLGITLITIAHRRSVWKYHNWILRFDGNGGFAFSPLKFTDDGDLILTKVVHASDPDLIGSEMHVTVSTQEVKVHKGHHHRHHVSKSASQSVARDDEE